MFVFPKLAVFASGNGSNFQAIADAIKQLKILVKIEVLITDKKDAYAIERAKALDIPVVIVDYKEGREKVEETILNTLEEYKIDYIALAGFMRVLSSDFVNKYPGRILNVHPSILPKYKGLNAIDQALDNGDSELGVTVHFVDESLDGGPIIAQEIFPIEGLTREQVIQRVHQVEHILYVDALKKVVEGEVNE